MPRTRIAKRNTPVQGDMAWVQYRMPSVGEIETMAELDQGSAFTAGKELLVEHIVDWNWADENNNPLPLPGERLPGPVDVEGNPIPDPDTGEPMLGGLVIDDLTLEEFTQLSEILLSRGDSKN